MRPVLLLCAVIVACSEASTVWKQHWDKDPDLWRRDNSGEKTATQQTLPNTLLFVAEEYAQELGFTRERTEVTIHVLGGSFPQTFGHVLEVSEPFHECQLFLCEFGGTMYGCLDLQVCWAKTAFRAGQVLDHQAPCEDFQPHQKLGGRC